MRRWEIINALIKKNGYKSYLEIGLFEGLCFEKVKAKTKVSVDPQTEKGAKALPTYKMTSDDFFKQNKEKFDVIFIDGLHHGTQVLKDINNSLKILNVGGVIICHDMLPTEEIVQRVPRAQGLWTGDAWKAYFYIKGTREDLNMFVINADWGVGVIQKGKQKPPKEIAIPIEQMTWGFFDANKEKMDIISKEQFLEMMK